VLELGHNIVKKESYEWVYGLAFPYIASERLHLLGDVHAVDDEPVFKLGISTTLWKHCTLFASASRGFKEERKLLSNLGLRFNFLMTRLQSWKHILGSSSFEDSCAAG
jgi:hypothetical protein